MAKVDLEMFEENTIRAIEEICIELIAARMCIKCIRDLCDTEYFYQVEIRELLKKYDEATK